MPHAIGIALRAAAAAASDETRRLELLREAVSVLAPSGAQLEHVRALCDLGTALQDAHQTPPAREALEPAAALATGLNATATADRARRQLRRSGVRGVRAVRAVRAARTGASAEPGALTPAKLRVARLAAEDRPNAEIARLLFVTPRTVEWHLTQTYRKLAIRSRAGLAQALERATSPS